MTHCPAAKLNLLLQLAQQEMVQWPPFLTPVTIATLVIIPETTCYMMSNPEGRQKCCISKICFKHWVISLYTWQRLHEDKKWLSYVAI